MKVLEVRGLCVSLGGAQILHGVDLDVAPGEAVALLGPSGSGKTTLLYAIAGFVAPSAGTVLIGGAEADGPGGHQPPEHRSVGFVFQNYALWPHLNARRTVAYPLERSGTDPVRAAREADALLDLVGIGSLADRRPSELSGGQQQRVGLARALAGRAALYLLDEPTAHLDSALRGALQEELAVRVTAGGSAAVYATHDAAEAMAIADRVVLLREGRVVQQGSPTEVYERPADLWAARLTGPARELDGAAAGLGPGRVVVRPDWVEPGGGLPGTVEAVRFRGPHTDYRIATAAGPVEMRRPGPPEWGPGSSIGLRVTRWWAVGDGGPAPQGEA